MKFYRFLAPLDTCRFTYMSVATGSAGHSNGMAMLMLEVVTLLVTIYFFFNPRHISCHMLLVFIWLLCYGHSVYNSSARFYIRILWKCFLYLEFVGVRVLLWGYCKTINDASYRFIQFYFLLSAFCLLFFFFFFLQMLKLRIINSYIRVVIKK